MKVGTDGVLIGAWCRLPSSGRILDIGTGTGLIAVMAAQRASGCMVTGIDIDAECVAQARDNAASSPWGGRIGIEQCALQEFFPTHRFDAIVSNPPYFEESLLPPDARRTAARHTRSLTYAELVDGVVRLLDADGCFSLSYCPRPSPRGFCRRRTAYCSLHAGAMCGRLRERRAARDDGVCGICAEAAAADREPFDRGWRPDAIQRGIPCADTRFFISNFEYPGKKTIFAEIEKHNGYETNHFSHVACRAGVRCRDGSEYTL